MPIHGEREDVIGLGAGHQIASGLELDVELYDDHVHGGAHVTTLDVTSSIWPRPAQRTRPAVATRPNARP